MPFSMKFKTDNAAFADGNGESEVIAILEDIVELIEQGLSEGRMRDSNGNNIGTWKMTIDADENQEDEEDDE